MILKLGAAISFVLAVLVLIGASNLSLWQVLLPLGLAFAITLAWGFLIILVVAGAARTGRKRK